MSELIKKALRGSFGDRFVSHVSMPGEAGYDKATAIWPKPIGRVPRAVVHCLTAEDVQSAIRAAHDCDLPLSVRGGGHDWAARALCDGIVIDLSRMNGVAISVDKQAALIYGGARVANLLAVTDPLGLAAVTGSTGAVGMAGLTLGGGYGPLIGRFGLALDNLLAARVVLADGSIVFADAENEAELFWALRGGGGNFGVVTAMHHRLHELPSVCSGTLIYPLSEAWDVLERYADLAFSTSEELTVQVGFVAGPDGAHVAFVVPTWCGQPEEGEARLAPFLKLGTLLVGAVGTTPYGASLSSFDSYIVNGQRMFMETCWLPALGSASIDVFLQAIKTAVSPGCAIITHDFKGAASRVSGDATAFGLRRDHVLVEILAVCADRSDEMAQQRHEQWARSTRETLDAMAFPGGYPNLLGESDADRVAKSYGPNVERLIRAKRQYDSGNVFASAIPLPASGS
jgi:FAD binding domain/Berberine and berberine like